ncbi:MAG: bifunctional riboflavin kinase/FAD synthetase [Candidatus Syntrophonatronum acetioxidans]|uniref:Riboflavin biosynthesis protein n=1 Tax=Candidatus Syntrophonatronum acetioxidans TaxID=1795816 RepID=A0A424YDS1_9FIRM|nr:MAG: bifunctional riboflavin kinase/FAD synthetase [Candidatus Syntrophonatronum acetioxidans]
MEVFYELENYKGEHPLILALGNFDGLHMGHRKILEYTIIKATKEKARSGVLVFDPHPLKIINPSQEIPLLTPLHFRAELINEMGIDIFLVASFNEELAKIFPEDFVKDYLVKKFKVKGVVVGFDYSFGYGGLGKVDHLKKFGQDYGFDVEVIKPYKIKGRAVSSSLIRRFITSGEVEEASLYLGYHFTLEGEVVPGEGLGKIIGFPTANLAVSENLVIPGNGVYLTITSFRGRELYSLTNIGLKPTFQGKKRTIETHILDFNDNIYKHELRIKFLQKIRNEVPFANMEELKKQISQDIKIAREIISQEQSSSSV